MSLARSITVSLVGGSLALAAAAVSEVPAFAGTGLASGLPSPPIDVCGGAVNVPVGHDACVSIIPEPGY
ncbi:MAG TPA: hypothetical protein VFA63_12385 [Pseudonocardiaceae bacterium]|nr:hypothetical protein [Pseudonocardiaceae bacterium]